MFRGPVENEAKSPDATPARERFREAVSRDGEIDLAEASLLIAAEEYPRLDVGSYLRRLDALAVGARERIAGVTIDEPAAFLERFHDFLYREEGFRGNEQDYYDPRNSFLSDVIDRHTGIPISLATVYLEVARRVLGEQGVQDGASRVHGVGFPGHFLMRWDLGDDEMVVVDPFYGSILDEQDCKRLLARVAGRRIAFRPELLQPLPSRGMLVRMLANLKGIWLKGGDLVRAVSACDRILLLMPDAGVEHRDRGLLWLRLECFRPALADLETYAARMPDATDAVSVAEQIASLRRTVARMS